MDRELGFREVPPYRYKPGAWHDVHAGDALKVPRPAFANREC